MKQLLKFNKKRIIASVVSALILAILISYSYLKKELSVNQLLLCSVLACCILFFILINYKLNKIVSGVVYALLPACSFFLLEWISHNPLQMDIGIIILNLIIYYLLFLLLLFLCGNGKVAAGIGLGISLFIGAANYFIVSFRSIPIMPWDLLSVKTAVSVADQYEFVLNYRFLLVVLCFFYLFVFSMKIDLKVKKAPLRIGVTALSLVLMFSYVSYVKTDNAKKSFGLDDILFTPNVLYRNNGFMVAFTMNLQYLEVEKPKDYSLETLKAVQEKYQADKEQVTVEKKPNIIVIMNEAFSDLAVNGAFETNQDYMPFIHSLSENTVKGNAYVSVKGGNTANSEFEFLTNSSMGFLPVGSVAYQQYIHSETPGLVGQLNDLGYQTVSMHPYNASGWNRDKVYDYFGFDKKYFISDFKNEERVRNYISDRATFQKIIKEYQAKEKDESLFVFDVTMQNHGSYTKEYDNLVNTISLTDTENKYLEQYLTLIKESDDAFSELVNYFKGEDEDTIILMFGDHQPADYVVKPIYKLNGMNGELSFEEEQNRYIVPYVMWSNFDVDETQADDISLNYLNTLLLEQAGLPLTDYQKYLKDLRQDIPVVTANMYMDSEGQMFPRNDLTKNEGLNLYSSFQYNLLFDKKNKLSEFYREDEE